MKMLRENDSGIWVITRIEEDADQLCNEPDGFGRAVKLPIDN